MGRTWVATTNLVTDPRWHMAIGPTRPALGRWVRGGRGGGALCRGGWLPALPRRLDATRFTAGPPRARSPPAGERERRQRGSRRRAGRVRGGGLRAALTSPRGRSEETRLGAPKMAAAAGDGCVQGRLAAAGRRLCRPRRPGAAGGSPAGDRCPAAGGRRWQPFARGRAVAAARCPPSGT